MICQNVLFKQEQKKLFTCQLVLLIAFWKDIFLILSRQFNLIEDLKTPLETWQNTKYLELRFLFIIKQEKQSLMISHGNVYWLVINPTDIWYGI